MAELPPVIQRIADRLKREKLALPKTASIAGKMILCKHQIEMLKELEIEADRNGLRHCAEILKKHQDGMQEIIETLEAASGLARGIKLLGGE